MGTAHLGHPPPDRPSLLDPQVQRKVLFVFVVLAEILASLLVHDGHHPCYGLADGVARTIISTQIKVIDTVQYAHFCQLGRRPASNLLHPQCQELILEVEELFRQVVLGPNRG